MMLKQVWCEQEPNTTVKNKGGVDGIAHKTKLAHVPV